MLSLRGHHLLCLQTYTGRGYDLDFVENLNRLVESLEVDPDQEIRLVSSCDSVCAACPMNRGGRCWSGGEPAETRVSRKDRMVLDLLGVTCDASLPFSQIQADVLDLLRRDPAMPQVCGDCEWWMICRVRLGEPFSSGS